MRYLVTVVITRRSGSSPAGVTEVRVTSEVQAISWGAAVNEATGSVLDDYIRGGLVGSQITEILVRAAA